MIAGSRDRPLPGSTTAPKIFLKRRREADVALVLGFAKTLSSGRTNIYFQYRIDSAAEAFAKAKCRYLIVSGDNRSQSYNEPDLMKEALILRCVPEDRIVCDYAGLRTLDSVVRAQQIFGQRCPDRYFPAVP